MSERRRTTTGERIRVGVVGVGQMGQHHVRIYTEHPGVELVGVTDADHERAVEVAAEHGTRALDQAALLDRVDAVSIVVPTPAHAPVARTAIDAGVGVLIEKPLVDDLAAGRDLVERASAAGVTLQVGHVERFNPAVEALDDVLADLEVIAIDARRLGPPVDRAVTDSVAVDLMIHDIDVLLSLLDGEIEGLTAVGACDNRHVTATLQFDDGVVASLTASRVTQRKVRELVITAEDCWIVLDYIDQSVRIHRRSLPSYVQTDGSLRYRHESVVEQPTIDNGEPLKRELSAFVEAVRTGAPPAVTGEDGLRALELATRIDELAAGRLPVEVAPE